MARRRLGKEKAIAAIKAANGVISVAARSLHASRSTLHRYINEDDDVRAAYDEANETVLDEVENVLVEQARAGDREQVRFYLRTKGRSRGYGDRQEITGADGGPIRVIDFNSPPADAD